MFVITHSLSNELQILELTLWVCVNQVADLGNGHFTTSSTKIFNLPVDFYNITMGTLDCTFYSVEPGCITTYNASKVLVHFLGHVTMPKISSLMFEQRHVFDSGTLYINGHKDDLVRKAREAPLHSLLTHHNYSQWIMKLLGLLKP